MGFKVVLIGVGHLGRFHGEKLLEIPGVDLLYLVDLREERLREVAETLRPKAKIPLKFTCDYREVLSEGDLFVVATPTTTHYEIAKAILSAKKPLFLEKPITSELWQGEELVEIAERNRVPFQVGYIERYQSAVKLLLEKVRNPLFIEAHRLSEFVERNLDIDVVLDLMIHDLDLVFCVKGGFDLEFMHAVGAPIFTDKPDIVNVRLLFRDGTTCNLTASRISLSKQRKFRVFERGVYYSVDTLEKSFLEIRPKTEERDFYLDKKIFSEDDPLREELLDFISAVKEKREVSVSGREALESLRMALKIKEEVSKNLERFGVL